MKKWQQQFQTRQHMVSSDYEIYHYFDRGMDSVRLHHHDFFEVYFLIGGNVSTQIEGGNFNLEPEDIILIHPSELHQTIVHNHDRPYERIVLWLDRSYVSSLSTDQSDLGDCFELARQNNVIRTNVERRQYFRSLLNKLLSMTRYKGFGSDLYPKVYVTEILLFLNEELAGGSDQQSYFARNSCLIDSVIDYINEHIDEDIRLDTLADLFYLSKFHLSRKFKEQTGTTLHRYIVQKKLIFAKELIAQNQPIIEVYRQSGFGDYSNFFRAFKNEYGITPKQYYGQISKSAEDH